MENLQPLYNPYYLQFDRRSLQYDGRFYLCAVSLDISCVDISVCDIKVSKFFRVVVFAYPIYILRKHLTNMLLTALSNIYGSALSVESYYLYSIVAAAWATRMSVICVLVAVGGMTGLCPILSGGK